MSKNGQILVLTTGGTIDKQYFDALSAYQITDTTVTMALKVACVTRAYEIRELIRKDSIDFTDEDRQCIVRHVLTANQSRIVITHGTDTMTATATALSRIPLKTIVLTGAFTPARFSLSDAPFNLGMAFAAAQLAEAGVYIAMNGSIVLADRVKKDRDRCQFVLREGV